MIYTKRLIIFRHRKRGVNYNTLASRDIKGFWEHVLYMNRIILFAKKYNVIMNRVKYTCKIAHNVWRYKEKNGVMRNRVFLCIAFVYLSWCMDFTANALTVVVDNLRYSLYESSHNATLTGKQGVIRDLVIPSEITYGGQSYTVNMIGEEAFAYDGFISSVTILGSIKYIKFHAFSLSTGIKEVNASSLENWLDIEFEGEDSNPITYAKALTIGGEVVRRMVIPEGTERIHSYAFAECGQILTVTMPTSLREIGFNSFGGCDDLQRIIFPDEVAFLSLQYKSESCHLNYRNSAKYYITSKPFNTKEVVIPEEVSASALTYIMGQALILNRLPLY